MSLTPGSLAVRGLHPPFKLASYLPHQSTARALALHQLVVTSPYGARSSGWHSGLDLRARTGTPVYAIGTGKVTAVYTTSATCGYGVEIDHGSGWKSRYCHLSRIDVREGDRLWWRKQIGLSGGNAGTPGAGSSAAEHLHVALYHNGRITDPAPYIRWYPFAVDYADDVKSQGRAPEGYSFTSAVIKVKVERAVRLLAVTSAVGLVALFGYHYAAGSGTRRRNPRRLRRRRRRRLTA